MENIDKLISAWEAILNMINCQEDEVNLPTLQHILFDTYHFFKKELTGDTIPRSMLGLYKAVEQFVEVTEYVYLQGISESETELCKTIAYGLCYEVENGLKPYYYEHALPIYLNWDRHFNGQQPVLNMATIETFVDGFDKEIKFLREECGYDEDEEE